MSKKRKERKQKEQNQQVRKHKYVRYLFTVNSSWHEGTDTHMIAGVDFEDCVKNLGLIWGATREDIVSYKKSGGDEPTGETDGIAHED